MTVPRGEHSRFGVEAWHATLYGPDFSDLAARASWEVTRTLSGHEFSPGQRANQYAVDRAALVRGNKCSSRPWPS